MNNHTNLRQCSLLFFILGFRVFLSEFAILVSLNLFIKMQGKIDQLKLMGPVILNAILKMLDGFTGSEAGQLFRKKVLSSLYMCSKVDLKKHVNAFLQMLYQGRPKYFLFKLLG